MALFVPQHDLYPNVGQRPTDGRRDDIEAIEHDITALEERTLATSPTL